MGQGSVLENTPELKQPDLHADTMPNRHEELPMWAALLPLIFAVTGLSINFIMMGGASLDGPNQLILIAAGVMAILPARLIQIPWSTIETAIVETISGAMPAIIIVMVVGALIASWFIGGIVPTLIFYGLKIISPQFFYVTAVFLCCITSLAMGSSWSTTATVGVALFGISQALGLHAGMSIGAIISGAYFGDKMSPLSDTTNLAAASAKVNLLSHIASMRVTTFPTMLITFLVFLTAGLMANNSSTAVQTHALDLLLTENYNIQPVLLLAPVFVGIALFKKMPALLVMVTATIIGVSFAIIFQSDLIIRLAGGTDSSSFYIGLIKALSTGFKLPTDLPSGQRVLQAGGMAGMLPTVWLIISAMIFGGALHGSGALGKITHALLKAAATPGKLIASTAGAAIFTNTTASDHFLSIVVPARIFAPAYEEQNLAPEVLSRTLEDAGTVTSPLVPWNTCSAYQASVFAVDPLVFIPYCIFNILSPFISVLFGYLGIGQWHKSSKT